MCQGLLSNNNKNIESQEIFQVKVLKVIIDTPLLKDVIFFFHDKVFYKDIPSRYDIHVIDLNGIRLRITHDNSRLRYSLYHVLRLEDEKVNDESFSYILMIIMRLNMSTLLT